MTYNVGNGIEGACSICGCYPCWCDWIDAKEECSEEERKTHYHVVEFINGCLNDYDSGPFEDREDARIHLLETVNANNESPYRRRDYVQAGEDRYKRGLFILKIEECSEDCESELDPLYFSGMTNEEGEGE